MAISFSLFSFSSVATNTARVLRIDEFFSLRQLRTGWQTAVDDSHFFAHRLQLSSDQEYILLVETDDAVAGWDVGQTARSCC